MNDQEHSADAARFGEVSGQLGEVLSAADVGVWRLHLPSLLATWDQVASRVIYGVAEPQVTPAPLPIHPEDQCLVLARLQLVEAGGGGDPLTVRVVRPDGTIRWIRASARRPVADSGSGEWLVGIVTDVTEEKEARSAALESQRQLVTLIDHLPGVAYRCELQEPWLLTYVSHGAEALTGRPVTDFTSGHICWAHLMHADDVARVSASVETAIRGQVSSDVSYRLLAGDGSWRWVQERGRAYYEDGQPRFLEGFIWDISDAKRAEAKARWIANHDALTQLPNRILLQESIEAKIAQGAPQFSVLLLDVDDFKRTNDTLGHDAGDALLREFAKRLTELIGNKGLVGRLGGDEFAIVLDGVCDAEAIRAAGQNVLEALSAPLKSDLGLLSSSASIGASIFGQHGRSWTEILKCADIALYAAKAAGRKNLKLFSNDMLNEVQVRNSMLALAGAAVEHSGIIPHYQPQVDLRSGGIVGFEALLRWENAGGALRQPSEIAAAFDDPVLAVQLSDQMIEAVIRDMRSWLHAGLPFGHVAINASPAEFRRGDFADRLLEALEAAEIDASLLQVEVTESVFIGRGSRHVEDALRSLHAAGVKIALDDFGTGYASLLHLAEYPVRFLKIDRSFVSKMTSSSHDNAIVQAVISLGGNLGMKVTAEGVETLEQEARLRSMGCDFAQGFFYAPGVSAHGVRALCCDAAPRFDERSARAS